MSSKYVHPATNRAIVQAAEDTLARKAQSAYLRGKQKKYWVINKNTNRRSSGAVSMEKFLDYVGHNYAVAKQYELVPA